MRELDYLFMRAGIRFFCLSIDGNRSETIAILRNTEGLLDCVKTKRALSKETIDKNGLRSLELISSYCKKAIIGFSFTELNAAPTHIAKRELSALKLGINIPSLTPVDHCLNELTPWRELRCSRKLEYDLIDKTIFLLTVFKSKTPREIINSNEVGAVASIIHQLESWISNRKKHKIKTKHLRYTVKVLRDYQFSLNL